MKTVAAIAVAGSIGALARYGLEGFVAAARAARFRGEHSSSTSAVRSRRVRAEGLAGATVVRGIEGFGADSHLHTSRILRCRRTCPS